MNKLVIIGGGPAGYETAIKAKQAGLDVTLIEKNELGGVCLWEGCIPTKSLIHAAHLYQSMQKADQFGISATELTFDYTAMQVRKNGVIFRLHEGILFRLNKSGVRVIKGDAILLDPHTILVNQEKIEADIIFLATGSHCRSLSLPHPESERILYAKEALLLDVIPPSITIIGSGVIGSEFAALYRSLGSQVTMLELQSQLLPMVDEDISKRLAVAFKRSKIEVKTGVQVTHLSLDEQDKVVVHYLEKNKAFSLHSDYVLVATGRVPNLDQPSLNRVGIAYTPKGIQVNQHYQTNLSHIYALGDVNGTSLLAHSAIFQGEVALNHVLHRSHTINPAYTPNVLFTQPEIAYVGAKESELEAGTCRVYKSLYTANCMATIQEETYGFAKLLVRNDGKILGAHIIGSQASLLIAEMVVAIQKGCHYEEFQAIIHVHPTLSELWQDCK